MKFSNVFLLFINSTEISRLINSATSCSFDIIIVNANSYSQCLESTHTKNVNAQNCYHSYLMS